MERYSSNSICVEGVKLLSSHSCGTYVTRQSLCLPQETYTTNGVNKSILYFNSKQTTVVGEINAFNIVGKQILHTPARTTMLF